MRATLQQASRRWSPPARLIDRFPVAERRWLAVLAAVTAAEWLWWALLWERGVAPLPRPLPYLLMTGAIAGAAMLLRLALWRPAVETSAAAMGAGAVLVGAGASAFLPIKYAIPKLVPFWLDGPLVAVEGRLFGAEPWAVLDRLLGWAAVPLDWLYGAWLPSQTLVLFLVMAARPSEAKTRALTAYALCWFLLGVVAATLLSSAGPVFYDRLTGGDAFAALAPTLRGRGAWILFAESDPMWRSFASGRPGFVAGISAMPSIHVAISLWVALVARSLEPRAAVPAFLYFALIWIASVQLGWHYVLDGLAGAVGMLLIWAAAGRLTAFGATRTKGV